MKFNIPDANIFALFLHLIHSNNSVRFIDVFVDNLEVVDFGCKDVGENINSRSPFDPADLLGYVFPDGGLWTNTAVIYGQRPSEPLKVHCPDEYKMQS